MADESIGMAIKQSNLRIAEAITNLPFLSQYSIGKKSIPGRQTCLVLGLVH